MILHFLEIFTLNRQNKKRSTITNASGLHRVIHRIPRKINYTTRPKNIFVFAIKHNGRIFDAKKSKFIMSVRASNSNKAHLSLAFDQNKLRII